jgi:putative transposase
MPASGRRFPNAIMPFPERLHHQVPSWVDDGSAFHIRIRSGSSESWLDDEGVRARALLNAAQFYHEHQRWFCRLILIIPHHLHAILSFSRDEQMSKVLVAWKSVLAKNQNIEWQDG